MQDERLLKLPDVCQRLALSRTAIYRLIKRGQLHPLHFGGAVRFAASDLDQLIETLKGEPHAHAV